MKVSVVVTAYNEEEKLEACLDSVKKIASEIVVVDSSSTDNTSLIAKKYTPHVYKRENNPMLNVNKNFGFGKASSRWILSLDSDERVSEELGQEIISLPEESDVCGYFIPRRNFIFGKWIKHTGWYPDYQLRLFQKNKGRFPEKHVHEFVSVDGLTDHLKSDILHINYESITQFLEKMIRTYTVSEADALIVKGYQFSFADLYRMPISEFVSRFFSRKGYRDGMHGFVLSLLMAFYHFVIFLRLWEKNNFKESEDAISLYKMGGKYTKKQIGFWFANEMLEQEKNPVKKQLYRFRRKRNAS